MPTWLANENTDENMTYAKFSLFVKISRTLKKQQLFHAFVFAYPLENRPFCTRKGCHVEDY